MQSALKSSFVSPIVCFPSETPLEKRKFSFASSCPLVVASGLGIETCIYFFQVLDTSGLHLCRPCASYPSLCEFICASIFLLRGPCFFGVLHPWIIHSFHLLFNSVPWPWREGLYADIVFWAECSTVSHSLHIVWVWVSVFDLICCRRKFLW